MLETLQSRKEFVQNLVKMISSKFDITDTQIFIFGSFLTEDYIPGKSDIDIGIFSEDETKMYDIRYELSNYLQEIGLKFDIVIMTLSKKLLINIPIMVYGETYTDYDNNKFLPYLKSMIDRYGFLEKGLDEAAYE
jgi:predicted nucleotidyltransferase